MKTIPVKHFSVQSDLKELDPKFQGSGMVGAEKNRPNRIPRTYYYHRNASPEGVVTAGAHHEYHGELPSGTNLYNMGEDPLGLNKPSWKQTKHGQVYNVPDLDAVERTLARKGFHGYENYGVDGALAYFHKLPVTRAQMARSPILKRKLKKALPKGAKLDVNNPGDQTANIANRQGFPGSPQHMVMEDAGGGTQVRGVQPNQLPHPEDGYLGRVTDAHDFNSAADTERGWGDIRDPNHRWEPADSWAPTNNEFNPANKDDIQSSQIFWSHPNFYEWHDAHTSHHNPHPWDKQQALDTARGLGLVKNDQAAGVGAPRYAEFAMPFGKAVPGQHSNLKHYNYDSKLPDVSNLVNRHGFKVYYAGGKYGKPDLANRNYDTGHLMIYDPTPHSGGDFNERNYTDAWRQMHELSHALTHHELNNVYGEGRRIGALGTHRNLNEAMRAVHWEWLAAHKQRDLNKQIGIHVPDETFHKELNTIMHDAVHRAVTGRFTEPSQEGFVPHSHKVPLETALDMVRKEGQRIGLQGHHELIRKHEPRPMVKFVKALPKGAKLDVNNRGDQTENTANRVGFHAHQTPQEQAVFEDGGGGVSNSDVGPTESPFGIEHNIPVVGNKALTNAYRANQMQTLDNYPEGAPQPGATGSKHWTYNPVHDEKIRAGQIRVNAQNTVHADALANDDSYWSSIDQASAISRSPILKRKK